MSGLQALLAFTETAKHGGFAAAARELGTAPSTLAKAVGRLEASLGLRLFHRTTRQHSLTADGERLYLRCQRVLAELDELQSEAAGVRAEPRGVLRIDMPIAYGRCIVLPVLARLLEAHPALELDARFSDAHVDLVRGGIDLAVRVGELADSSLVARRIDAQVLLTVASPAYLQRHGVPADVGALDAHAAIVFRMPGHGRDLPQRHTVDGRTVTRQPARAHRFNDGDAMVQAAVQQLGVAQVPDYMAADELTAGRLVEVLHQARPPPTPIHAVMPAQRLMPPRVRALLDALVALPPRALPDDAAAPD